MKRVRFVMIGGFLGAGKTTTIAKLARKFVDAGQKVGLVTNDQAYDLVDTLSLRSQGFDVGEVPGACFCCKFDDLVETATQLAADQQPDVIIAEPVGSCTDLVATVVEPLRHLYGERYEIAPFAVLLKPEHGKKILGQGPGAGFSPQAEYIFLKQLEEADVVVLNKIDKLDDAQQNEILGLLRGRFPDKEIITQSALRGDGLDDLAAVLDRPEPQHNTPEIDYDVYAKGEAELGWLNCKARVWTGQTPDAVPSTFSLDELLAELVERLRTGLARRNAEPAHLKVLAMRESATSQSDAILDFAIANLVGSGVEVELSRTSDSQVVSCELVVNARVATSPEELLATVEAELAALAAARELEHEVTDVQSFRPGRPVPTHRMPVD